MSKNHKMCTTNTGKRRENMTTLKGTATSITVDKIDDILLVVRHLAMNIFERFNQLIVPSLPACWIQVIKISRVAQFWKPERSYWLAKLDSNLPRILVDPFQPEVFAFTYDAMNSKLDAQKTWQVRHTHVLRIHASSQKGLSWLEGSQNSFTASGAVTSGGSSNSGITHPVSPSVFPAKYDNSGFFSDGQLGINSFAFCVTKTTTFKKCSKLIEMF